MIAVCLFKGIVHPKIHVIPNLYNFLSSVEHKGRYLKKNTVETNGSQNCLVSNILQIIWIGGGYIIFYDRIFEWTIPLTSEKSNVKSLSSACGTFTRAFLNGVCCSTSCFLCLFHICIQMLLIFLNKNTISLMPSERWVICTHKDSSHREATAFLCKAQK